MPSLSAKILALSVLALALALSDGAAPVVAQGTGSISGRVYFDLDMNGERDAGEPPLSRQTVELRPENGEVIRTRTSAGDGSYRFSGLLSDTDYEVSLRPDDHTLCLTTGGWGVSGGGDYTDIDLGMVLRGKGRVVGAVIADLNESGGYDRGEPSLERWDVTLGGITEAGSPFGTLSATTGPMGTFEFRDLPPLAYSLYLEPPSPRHLGPQPVWELTFATGGVPVSTVPNLLTSFPKVDLRHGRGDGHVELGVHILSGAARISGVIFSDLDLDGVHDQGEPLLPCCWPIRFWRASPVGLLLLENASPPPNLDGRLELAGLPGGTYLVELGTCWTNPTGPTSEPGECPSRWVTVSEGEGVGNVDFGFAPQGVTPQPPTATNTPQPRSPLPPDVGVGGTPPESALPGFAAALAVAGALAVAASALAVRRKARFRR
jgi:hypothetical protein